MQILLRKANLPLMQSTGLLQWNPGNGKWYPINERNVEVQEGLRARAELMNQMLQGDTIRVKAAYNRQTKKLTVKNTLAKATANEEKMPRQILAAG